MILACVLFALLPLVGLAAGLLVPTGVPAPLPRPPRRARARPSAA